MSEAPHHQLEETPPGDARDPARSEVGFDAVDVAPGGRGGRGQATTHGDTPRRRRTSGRGQAHNADRRSPPRADEGRCQRSPQRTRWARMAAGPDT